NVENGLKLRRYAPPGAACRRFRDQAPPGQGFAVGPSGRRLVRGRTPARQSAGEPKRHGLEFSQARRVGDPVDPATAPLWPRQERARAFSSGFPKRRRERCDAACRSRSPPRRPLHPPADTALRTITKLKQKSGANVRSPPTAADFQTIKDGPPSTQSRPSSRIGLWLFLTHNERRAGRLMRMR